MSTHRRSFRQAWFTYKPVIGLSISAAFAIPSLVHETCQPAIQKIFLNCVITVTSAFSAVPTLIFPSNKILRHSCCCLLSMTGFFCNCSFWDLLALFVYSGWHSHLHYLVLVICPLMLLVMVWLKGLLPAREFPSQSAHSHTCSSGTNWQIIPMVMIGTVSLLNTLDEHG